MHIHKATNIFGKFLIIISLFTKNDLNRRAHALMTYQSPLNFLLNSQLPTVLDFDANRSEVGMVVTMLHLNMYACTLMQEHSAHDT